MGCIFEAIFGFILAVLADIFVGVAVIAAGERGAASPESAGKNKEAKDLTGKALQLEITKQGAVLSLKTLRNSKQQVFSSGKLRGG